MRLNYNTTLLVFYRLSNIFSLLAKKNNVYKRDMNYLKVPRMKERPILSLLVDKRAVWRQQAGRNFTPKYTW